MDQLLDFFEEIYLPAVAKEFKGMKGVIAKGIRGEYENQLAIIWYFRTEADRDKYFKPEGGFNERGKQVAKKLEGVIADMNKLATWKSVYTDWVMQ